MIIDLIDLNQLVSVKTDSKKKSAKKVLLNDLLHFNYLFWSVLPVGSDPSGRFKFYSIIVFKSNMVVNNNRIYVGELLLYYLCNQNDTKITDKFRMSSVIIYLKKIISFISPHNIIWMLIDIFDGFNKAFLSRRSNLIIAKLRAYDDFFLVKSSPTVRNEASLNESFELNLSFYAEIVVNSYNNCIAWFFIKFLVFHSMLINFNSTCISNNTLVPTYINSLYSVLRQIENVDCAFLNWSKYTVPSMNIKYTVFYQNFGFPYLFNMKVVFFRTCSDTLVPTYNYPLWIILVQLFYLG